LATAGILFLHLKGICSLNSKITISAAETKYVAYPCQWGTAPNN
jgi:hypothetical protein